MNWSSLMTCSLSAQVSSARPSVANGALLLGQVDRDRPTDSRPASPGCSGSMLIGRDVEPELGLGAQEQELADPAHLHARRDAEADA